MRVMPGLNSRKTQRNRLRSLYDLRAIALRVARTIVLVISMFAAFLVAPATATELLGLRFGPDGDKTRVVFDLVGAPDFEITGDTEENGHLIVTFHGMATGAEGINGFRGKGLISRYAYGPDGARKTKISLTFKRTAKIAQVLTLDPSGKIKKHRLVIDLVTADKTAFLASLPKPASPSEIDEDRLGAFMARETQTTPNGLASVGRAASNKTTSGLLTNRAISPAAIASSRKSLVLGPEPPSLKPVGVLDSSSANPQIASADIPTVMRSVNASPVRLGPPTRASKSSDYNQKSRLPVIVLDPGHGGGHPGAVGPGGTYEKDVNLKAALALADILIKTGRYQVILTRADDTKVELEQRAEIALDNHASLFLSLHADGNKNSTLRGSSVYTISDEGKKRSVAEARAQRNYKIADADMSEFSPVLGSILFDVTQKEFDRESRIFADYVLARLKGVTRLIKNAKRSEDLKVLLRPDLPAVLLEMAFISNPKDEANLNDPAWRKRTMGAVARAIDDYFAAVPETARPATAARPRSIAPTASGTYQ